MINIPWYAPKFSKEKCFSFHFYFVFIALSYVQGALVMNLWNTFIEHV